MFASWSTAVNRENRNQLEKPGYFPPGDFAMARRLVVKRIRAMWE